jgi:predicted mannosyl-3-phosphoglycerate phosphatase (HAD superfamily)
LDQHKVHAYCAPPSRRVEHLLAKKKKTKEKEKEEKKVKTKKKEKKEKHYFTSLNSERAALEASVERSKGILKKKRRKEEKKK